MTIRQYLQYLWLRGVHYRRIIDYIGNIEGSAHYKYIKQECSEEYSRMCSTMPVLLKENGFDMVFRNIIISPFYLKKIFNILRNRKDPLMLKRVNETMDGPIIYLLFKVAVAWFVKLFRDTKTRIYINLWRIKRHNNGVNIDVIRDIVRDTDFDCIIMSNKFIKIFSNLHSGIYQSLCKYGLRPLFILFSNRYSLEKKDNGYILEIPLHISIFPRYSPQVKLLLKEAISWTLKLDTSWIIRKKIISDIRDNFPQYAYLREIANEIFNMGKAKCLLALAENQIDYRIFQHQAKKFNLPTILYYSTDGIQPLIYEKYYSDIVLVCNRIQLKNFINLGYPPTQCNIVGSFNYSNLVSGISETASLNTERLYNILYFTKGTKAIDETIIDELIEKLRSFNHNYRLIVKRHPKDVNSFIRFKNKNVFITDRIDYISFVKESALILIVSQYSGVVQEIIPLRKPTILYTYRDILEYGERAFFQNARLPNYLKYVQNRKEFHNAIEELLDMKDPEPLPQELAEDLYGYMDNNCGYRIAKIVNSFVND